MSAATGDLARPSAPDRLDLGLSIVVVTWNCHDLALRCLQDVNDSRIGRDYEVIVVDNASDDGTAAGIAAAFPSVRLIVNAENAGFAKANNQGMALARGRHILLLNPDAFPTTVDTFAALLRIMDAHADIAALGCRLVHADGRHQVGDAGWRPSPAHVIVHGLGLSSLFPGARGLFLTHPPVSKPGAIVDVDWICGACLLLRADVVHRYGGFDENYFMYAEDVELGCRLRRHGLRLGYVASETVLHIQGGTRADRGPSVAWLDSLANLYNSANDGRHWFTFRASLGLGFLLRAAIYRAVALRKGQAFALRAAAMTAYARHVWYLKQP